MRYHPILNSPLTVCVNISFIIFLISFYSIINSCAKFPINKKETPIRYDQAEVPQKMGWWRAAFKIYWPNNREPLWYVDLILAHKIIAPILNTYQDRIVLWRFHRRAARDGAGHQFSFIFYCSSDLAATIMSKIELNHLSHHLIQTGKITEVNLQSTAKIKKPNLEATSDKHWSKPMQRAWPYYIQGISRMWLTLIDQYTQNVLKKKASPAKDLDVLYKKVDQKMIQTWQEEGSHALLHHLNALFGYRPLKLRMRF
jgi:hypothetical protein